MIVKLQTTGLSGFDGKVKEEDSWVYFDGFRKIKSIKLINLDGVDKYDSDYVAIDYKAIKALKRGYLLICSLKYTEEIKGKGEYVILTNKVTYLLNDEGKTIERLV